MGAVRSATNQDTRPAQGMNPLWFLRMSRWARNPPSARKVKLVIAVLLLCLALYAIERWIGWPDALSPERLRIPNRVSP